MHVMNVENRQPAYQTLADEAERLQTRINEFIGRATMARVDLPAAVDDANAELLLLPARLRETPRVARSTQRAAGMPALGEEAAGGDSSR
jgi:hypothetical protein